MTGVSRLKTYNQSFSAAAILVPDRIAVRHRTSQGYRQITYGELHRQIQGIARALVGRGLRQQDRVAILSENRPEWVVAYLGILMAGGCVVPLDPQISPEEWRRLLDDSEAKEVFVSANLLPKLGDAVKESSLRDHILCFDLLEGCRGGGGDLASLIERGHECIPEPQLPEGALSDVAVIIYTSGTTGRPKGVMLTQGNIVSVIGSALEAIPVVTERDIFLCLLPLHHVFASVVSFLLPLSLGAQIVFADTLKRSEILAALQEAGISILATVPQFFYLFHGRMQEELARRGKPARMLFRCMLRLNRVCMRRLRCNPGRRLFGSIHRNFGSGMRLFVSGGSAFDPKVAQDFHDLGFTILQGYGLTETTGPCAVTRIERNVIGSVGPPLPGTEIAIAEPDEEGVGEVSIRGPIVMRGYYRNPEETACVMRDGWFLSGDLGRLDGQGNLFITGRKKEVIVLPNGKNIYPDEIEAHYAQCAFIKEIAVVGIADPAREGSERLHAVVVPDFDALKAKKIANAREVLRDEIARLSNRLPHYKRLMSYQIQREELPRTTTRKVKRLELKKGIEKGELRDLDAAAVRPGMDAGDRALLESVVGQEVMACLRETYHRDVKIDPGMNIELELGFDSMERVELLASLEQTLGLQLPDGFGAEIHTVRDLIIGIQDQAGPAWGGGGAHRQSWADILSPEALRQEGELDPRFTGELVTHFRCVVLRVAYVLFRVLFRLEVTGREHLPRSGPFLICPNHVSYLDALIVLTALPYHVLRRVFFVGASDFFAGPFMKTVARIANVFPVDPDVHLLRAMKVGACGLRGGRVLCIFPEGARSFDGKPGPFKKGAAILAREVGVPMIPAAILGAYEAWPRDSRRIRLHKIRMVFGASVRADATDEANSIQENTDRLRQAVIRLMAND